MSKIIGFVALLFVGAIADSCGDSLTYKNISVNFDYVGASGSNSVFSIAFHNNLPGVAFPNSPAAGAMDVHSFCLVDPATTGIKPVHLDFGNINGGAFRIISFSVPTSMTGSNKCLDMAFYYTTKAGVENYFYGSLSLSTVAKRSEAVAEVDVEENNLAARASCSDVVYYPTYGDWSQSSTDPTATYNSFYFSTTSFSAITKVGFNVTDPSGQLAISYGSAHYWANVAKSTTTSGSIAFAGCYVAGTYTLNIVTNYFCGTPATAYSVSGTHNLVCA